MEKKTAEISHADGGEMTVEAPSMKASQWLAENRAAMEAWNDYVEEHGLPLAEFRAF